MVYPASMDTPSRPEAQQTTKDNSRDERLAAALRENLKRRKAQARSQASGKEGEQKPAKGVTNSGS